MKRSIGSGAILLAALLLAGAPTASGQLYTTDNPQLAYWPVGEGAPTIVVLHGGPGLPHTYLRPEWDRLSDAGGVVFYDQRGCGHSGFSASYGWREHVGDLERLVAIVAPDAPVVLAGTSWGAMLALLYTREHPERVSGLVLSGVPPWPSERSRYAAAPGPPAIDEEGTPVAISPRTHPDFYGVDSLFGQRLPDGCPPVATRTMASLQGAPPLSSLREITHPVLILEGRGRGDFPDGSADLHNVLPASRHRVIPDAGHVSWYNDPETFFAEAAGFIRGLDPSQISRGTDACR